MLCAPHLLWHDIMAWNEYEYNKLEPTASLGRASKVGSLEPYPQLAVHRTELTGLLGHGPQNPPELKMNKTEHK